MGELRVTGLDGRRGQKNVDEKVDAKGESLFIFGLTLLNSNIQKRDVRHLEWD